MNTSEERLASIHARIQAACERAGREPGSVRLLGVSKLHSAEEVAPLVRAGCLELGENYVQEARDKQAELARLDLGPTPPVWHLIGPLQSNKAKLAAELFSWIHTLDRLGLAEKLGAAVRALGNGKTLNVLVQVNTSGEDSKSGVAPEEAPELCAAVARVEGLALRGLMCIPQPSEAPEASRPEFRALVRLLKSIQTRLDVPGFSELSMGMSSDLEVAVEEGATIVRVGTALFGPRPAGRN